MIDKLSLFIDESVDNQTKVGCGTYLIVDDSVAEIIDESKVQSKTFENTSSTKLELQTLLWALSD